MVPSLYTKWSYWCRWKMRVEINSVGYDTNFIVKVMESTMIQDPGSSRSLHKDS